MNASDPRLIAAAISEITTPEWGVTKQFLDVHAIAMENGQPKIAGTVHSNDYKQTVIYFAVERESFFLALCVLLDPQPEVCGVYVEAWHRVYLRVTSDTLNMEQLAAYTSLQPTDGWNKGDKRKSGTGCYTFTSLEFQPNPEPDDFESKLTKLLDFLEQDPTGVLALVSEANGCISVASNFYKGALGGFHLDQSSVRRLATLNLEIDFDLYAGGNSFKD